MISHQLEHHMFNFPKYYSKHEIKIIMSNKSLTFMRSTMIGIMLLMHSMRWKQCWLPHTPSPQQPPSVNKACITTIKPPFLEFTSASLINQIFSEDIRKRLQIIVRTTLRLILTTKTFENKITCLQMNGKKVFWLLRNHIYTAPYTQSLHTTSDIWFIFK